MLLCALVERVSVSHMRDFSFLFSYLPYQDLKKILNMYCLTWETTFKLISGSKSQEITIRDISSPVPITATCIIPCAWLYQMAVAVGKK